MRFTEEEKLTLVEHYKSGATASSICAEAGIARSTFYSWVKPYGTVLTKGNELITLRELDKLRKHTEKLENMIAVLKLANCSVSSPLQEKLSEMTALHGQFSVHVLCDALNVPRGTFYNHIFRNKGENTLMAARREDFRGIIREIFDDSNQLFGAEKITAVLQSRGFDVGKKFVLQLIARWDYIA